MTGIGSYFSLKGKVALIAGGGRGLGAAIAEVFLEAEATVVINALTDVYLSRTVDRLGVLHGDRVIGLTGDAASAEGASGIVARAMERAPSIDILVNGVGDAIHSHLVQTGDGQESSNSVAKIESTIDINLMSAIHCTRSVGAAMIQRGSGRIINVASVIGALKGQSGFSVYSAGKAGLIGFTRSLAREWGRYSITVNAIAPGIFPDEKAISAKQYAAIKSAYLDRIPLGRFGSGREVGCLALYLASDAASYVTGQVFAVDGGLSA
jgi:NAD(P)-dependent dehydrogenase (short-subunit alcohol dehydrogenase family)